MSLFNKIKKVILLNKVKKMLVICIILFTCFNASSFAYEIEEETDYVWLEKQIQETYSNITNEPKILSRYAVVFDRNSKTMLYEKNSEKEVPMASTTKIMTAVVFVENNKNLDEEVEVCKQAANIGGSRLGLKTGNKITKEDLLYGLMLCSRE